MTYIFILGRHPSLSIAEITRALEREGIRAKFRYVSSEAAVIETTAELSRDFFYGLGGSVKFGRAAATCRQDAINKTLLNFFKKERTEAKLSFGISVYPLEEGVQTGRLRRELSRAGIEIKKQLKDIGPVRFVTSRESTLSSVVVETNHVTEALVLLGSETVLIGKTTAVQAFGDLSFRDYGRPGRSAKSGMLPPKLARMMLNLSAAPRDGVVLDPFCGSGTVVTEAMSMGFRNIIGSDFEPAAVSASEQNVSWMREHYPETKRAQVKVMQAPAEEISLKIPQGSIHAIVTEPYLGPPRTGREPRAVLEARAAELGTLYARALDQFGRLLIPGGTAVMVIPQFVSGDEPVRIDLTYHIRKLGFSPAMPWLPFLYSRKDQMVQREIWVLKR